VNKTPIFLYLFIFLLGCQPIEKIDYVVFDNNQLSNFKILTNSIEIIEIFEKKISDPYIGHTLKVDPSERIRDWINNNFLAVGNENKFKVLILDASITQNKFENKDAKNFDEKTNYKYELNYLIEFTLYDSYNNFIASTLVESSRSTTSGIYISLDEKENIINDLIYQSLKDLSNESKKLLIKFMRDFIL
tara:strand:- start:40 stop:609 length:570 start_codon:yes stop_codon:yes gene_type:complete